MDYQSDHKHGFGFWVLGALVVALLLTGCVVDGIRGTDTRFPPPVPTPTPDLQNDPTYVRETRSDDFTTRYTQRTDILGVIDNSGSMSQERTAVRDNFGTFHQLLNSRRLNEYRLAITTTDAHTREGAFLASAGVDIVDGTSPDPVNLVVAILNSITDSAKSYWEQGLKASERALTNHGARFLRPNTDLAIIYLSDEQDYSCLDATGSPTGRDCPGMSLGSLPETQNPRTWTHVDVDWYRQYFQGLGRTVMVYPIVGTAARTCQESSKGTRYQLLQEMIGTGFTSPICNDVLADNFTRIADEISARGDCYALAQTPLGEPGDWEVTVDGTRVDFDPVDGFSWDATSKSICFQGDFLPPAGESLRVTYDWLRPL